MFMCTVLVWSLGGGSPPLSLSRSVYESLRASPAWNETLLVITYDEHGRKTCDVSTARRVEAPNGDREGGVKREPDGHFQSGRCRERGA